MTDITNQKSAAREAAYALRKAVHEPDRSATACRHLLDYLRPMARRSVSGYMPIRTEIDVLPAMIVLSQTVSVGVPVIIGPGKPLEFHQWTPAGEMQKGPFGASIPVSAVRMVPQIVVLPLLAFDAAGHRLGYGGGYYDRTLQLLRAAGPVHAVGFAYQAQAVKQVPTEATDQPLDAIVTDAGVTKIR